MRFYRLVCLTILSTAIFATSTFAQKPTPTPRIDDNEVIKVSSRLVVVPTAVTDANGNSVQGLTASDFKIVEEGKLQTIESVSPGDKVPLEIALLFDVSASTDAMFKFEQDTAAKFLRDVMKADDRATIYTIGIEPKLIIGRADMDKAVSAASGLVATAEPTAFFDTVVAAANYLRANSPEHSRKVLVVISDGDDNYSELTRQDYRRRESQVVVGTSGVDLQRTGSLVAQAQQAIKLKARGIVSKGLQDADMVFYSINPGGSSYQLNQISVFGQQNMEGFATDTGGTAFLPKFLPVDTKLSYDNATNTRLNNEMLDKIFRQIESELRSQYLVQYYSETDFPNGRYVKLDVAVPTHPAVKVRARQGYYAKN